MTTTISLTASGKATMEFRKHDQKLAKLLPILVSTTVSKFNTENQKFIFLLESESPVEGSHKILKSTPDRLRKARLFPESMESTAALAIINTWLSAGFTHVAAATFIILFPVIKGEPSEVVTPLLPTIQIVDWWIKNAKVSKSQLLKSVTNEPEKYQQSVLLDWAIKQAPIKHLYQLLKPVFSDFNQVRPAAFASGKELLAIILRRDRLATLAHKLLAEAQQSNQSASAFLDALQSVPTSWPAWSLAMAHWLWGHTDTDADSSNNLRDEIIQQVIKGPEKSALFLSLVTAYSLTHHQMVFASNKLPLSNISIEALPELAKGLLHRAGSSLERDYWIVAPASVLRSVMEIGDSKISTLGARLLGQGLREMEYTSNVPLLFTAVALNLGMAPIGEVGQAAFYEPEVHEDAFGGLLPGDNIVIHSPGWKHAEQIIMRATVKPCGKNQ